jgi:hypothetical protein
LAFVLAAGFLHKRTRIQLQSPENSRLHQDRLSMISRRHLLRCFAGLGAAGVSIAAYGFGAG